MIVVSMVVGCAPYTHDANGNPVPARGSVAYHGKLTTPDNCGTPDRPKACSVKRQAAPSGAPLTSSPQSYTPIPGAPVY